MPPDTALARREPPNEAPTYVTCAIEAFRETTLPFVRTALARSLDLGDDGERYDELWYALARDLHRPPTLDGYVHRLLGHADAIQGDMSRRLVYHLHHADLDQPSESLEAEARTWRLLLQLDSETKADMMWGDLGRVFFWIRDDALRARRFGSVLAVVQSG